jgi:hypothetical protein
VRGREERGWSGPEEGTGRTREKKEGERKERWAVGSWAERERRGKRVGVLGFFFFLKPFPNL